MAAFCWKTLQFSVWACYNQNVDTITIPRKFAGADDLIVVPKKEYEALLGLKRLKEFSPTGAQKKALLQAEVNFRKGKTISYHELIKKLGFTN